MGGRGSRNSALCEKLVPAGRTHERPDGTEAYSFDLADDRR